MANKCFSGLIVCLPFVSQAYLTICDVLVTFCNQLASNPNPAISELIYEADEELLSVLDSFIQSYVFIYEDEGINIAFLKALTSLYNS
jgi:hypothetical protein